MHTSPQIPTEIHEKARPRRRPLPPPSSDDPNKLLKQGIWLFFLLLIFEGALRKWILPGLATPLLVIRDPIAVGLVALAVFRGLLPLNGYVITSIAVGVVGLITSVAMGHGNPLVALYGGRILLFHLPLLFVIGRVFTREDVVKMGKATLWIAIPMAVLIALQFNSPQSAWVNRGIGGDIEGAGFDGAMGYFRPPGTFSFTNGTTLFFSLAGCYVFYFWLNPEKFTRFLLVAATAALLISIPLSISRALLVQFFVTIGFCLVAVIHKPKYLGQTITAALVLGVTLLALSFTPLFNTAAEVMTARLETADRAGSGIQSSLFDRVFGELIWAVEGSSDAPIFGHGLGMGTNVGSMLLAGQRQFLIAEGEWPRVIGELGPILGGIILAMRLILSGQTAIQSYLCLRSGDMLPWLLASFGFLLILQAGWAQPTALGFFTVTGGLMLASSAQPSTVTSPGPIRSIRRTHRNLRVVQ